VSTVKGHEGLAIVLGWHVLHIRAGRQRPGRGGWSVPIQGDLGKGWPDLVLVRPPRILAVELKRHPNKPTEDQLRILELLSACGVETFVWYPEDLELAGAVLSSKRPVVAEEPFTPLTVRFPVPSAVYGSWTEEERKGIARDAQRAVERIVWERTVKR